MPKQEPVLVNLHDYIVSLDTQSTPEGKFMSLEPGQAVAGPGFEKALACGKLTRVDAGDSKYTIVYETPADFKPAPAPVKPKVTRPKATADVKKKIDEAPDTRKASAPSPKPTVTKKKTILIPSVMAIRKMRKEDLVDILEKLGKKSDGARRQLANRLLPLADKEVKPKE